MPSKSTLGAALSALAVCAVLAAEQAHAADINITVAGLNSSAGKVICRVFAEGSGFPTSGAMRSVTGAIANGTSQCTFSGLPDGRYAVALVHDANGNGQLDRNIMGFPTEGFAFSQNIRPTFGPPSFAAAAFRLGPGGARLNLRVIYP
jgi:uncharacterized protein (DUF2141 family)